MKEHFKLLGHKVRDVVTGFTGMVTTISFDLYGCVQAVVTPEIEKKTGKRGESEWFDTKRLAILSKSPVMPIPSFDAVPGGDKKPAFPRDPIR
jgi:hypothetical protein